MVWVSLARLFKTKNSIFVHNTASMKSACKRPWSPSPRGCLHQSRKFYLTRNSNIFNRVNMSIQSLLIRARVGTALILSLLWYPVTFGENLMRYITTSSKFLVKLFLNCLTLKDFIKRTAEFGHFNFEQMNRRIPNCLSVKDGMSELGSFLDISR